MNILFTIGILVLGFIFAYPACKRALAQDLKEQFGCALPRKGNDMRNTNHQVDIKKISSQELIGYPTLPWPEAGKYWFIVEVLDTETESRIRGFRIAREDREVRGWVYSLISEGRLSVLANANYSQIPRANNATKLHVEQAGVI